MISPRRAPVKPRVISPATSDNVLLQDVVDSLLERTRPGMLEIVGGPGAGKTTALAHLASLPLADRLVLLDDATTNDLPRDASDRLVVYTASRSLKRTDASFELAPWCDDDLAEYLLVTQRDRCASVMARFTIDGDRSELDGVPTLYCLVAEQMAATEDVPDIRTGLRRGIEQQVAVGLTCRDFQFYASAVLLGMSELAHKRAQSLKKRGAGRELLVLLGNRLVQVLLSADYVISQLHSRFKPSFPSQPLPKDLVSELARMVQADPVAMRQVRRLVDGGKSQIVPNAASVLHVADPQWRPNRKWCSFLSCACLFGAIWNEIDLGHFHLGGADLRQSELSGANLEANLRDANLSGAQLQGARLVNAQAQGADFSGANMTDADVSRGRFVAARFSGAIMDHVVARHADFRSGDLRGASARSAVFAHAKFSGAILEGADFHGADLSHTVLAELVLRDTELGEANLSAANLAGCDLEFVSLPAGRLTGANLTGAAMTGSVLPDADLRHARLSGAGLADIEWERADLRQADLRGCTFHMGSSRSGLVGSPYPGHGSRTGFYTNDFDDQSFKSPAEIRKANLCGADLRGALVDEVDFYLVDLRGAKYDPEQLAHFLQCDAILFSRQA